MGIAARIATELTQKNITRDDFYKCMIALKLSRMARVKPTLDTFTDLIGYTEGWWNSLSEPDTNPTMIEFLKNLGKELQTAQANMKRPKGHEFTGGPIINEMGPEFLTLKQQEERAKKQEEIDRACKSAIDLLTNNGFKVTR